MFHKTNLGRFASHVEPFADLDGYVPEPGDHWSRMQWGAAARWNPDTWQEHVEAAVRATERAEQDLQAWRAGR